MTRMPWIFSFFRFSRACRRLSERMTRPNQREFSIPATNSRDSSVFEASITAMSAFFVSMVRMLANSASWMSGGAMIMMRLLGSRKMVRNSFLISAHRREMRSVIKPPCGFFVNQQRKQKSEQQQKQRTGQRVLPNGAGQKFAFDEADVMSRRQQLGQPAEKRRH